MGSCTQVYIWVNGFLKCSPWWCGGVCSGCCQLWRASRCSQAERTPVWGSTSCPAHTSHIRSAGRPSDTSHSSPSGHSTYTGELHMQKKTKQQDSSSCSIHRGISQGHLTGASHRGYLKRGISQEHLTRASCIMYKTATLKGPYPISALFIILLFVFFYIFHKCHSCQFVLNRLFCVPVALRRVYVNNLQLATPVLCFFQKVIQTETLHLTLSWMSAVSWIGRYLWVQWFSGHHS